MLDDIGSRFTTQSDIIARVVLHGRLRKKFGSEFTIAASTSARAVAVLCILKPGFRAALMEGEYRVVRGPMKGGVDLDERMLNLRLPPSGEMHIWPVAKGRKKGGIGKVIIGAVLVIAAVILAIPTGGGSLVFGASIFGAGALGGITVGTVALFGASMILGGITQMLSPQPKGSTAQDKSVDPAQSFLLGGQLNVAEQGVPIPVIYGRVRTGSIVVSVGYEAAEVAATAPAPPAQFRTSIGDRPIEQPNDLRSRALVRIIDVLGEGPIGGLVGGAQGIFLNGTPLQAADGTFNFDGVTWDQRGGMPDEDPVPGFPASEETIAVNTKVSRALGPIIQTVTSDTANALRLTVRVPSLFDTNPLGDTNPASVRFAVEIRPSRIATVGSFVGFFNQVIDSTISGKCTSPYERSYRIDLTTLGQGADANTWDIRMTRLSGDPDRTTYQNDIIFGLITLVTDHQLMYPDTAYVALIIDSQLFGSEVPTRSYLVDGLRVQVPANYDPPSRTYSPSGVGTSGGTWDTLSFHMVSTSNAAWVFYDMLTNTRYGCGIPGTSTEMARADLYVISQYCDGVVGDGFGGTERRYVVNAVITEQVEAYVMLQTMVSAFRGMTHWGAGQVVVTADMPKNPLKLVNQTNVLDGDFDYQGTSLKTRHNLVRVTWRDPEKQYTPVPEVVEMTADIARRGMIATDLVAWGCTTRGLAHRLGKWLLFTENNQVETVTYDASLYHLDMRPGDIFQQEDPLYFGLRYGGRLRAESTQSVLHLDSLVQLSGAPSYTLTVVMPDNTVYGSNNNTNPLNFSTSPDGTYTIITLYPQFALPRQPMPNAEWILVDSSTVPRLFQTVSVAQPQPGRYQVTAAQYNPGKFDYVEFGVAFPEQVFSHLPDLVLAALTPPSDVSVIDYMIGVGATQIIRVTVSWAAPSDIRVDHFQVQAHGVGVVFDRIYDANGASFDIDGLPSGSYTFAVRSITKDGSNTSVWVTAPDVLVDGKVDAPGPPLGFTVVGGTRRLMLSWIPVARRDIRQYEIQRAPYLNGFPTTYTTIAFIGGSSYIDGQSDVLLPNTRWFYRIRAVTFTDVVGGWSLDVWGQTTLLIVDDLADGIINTAKFAHGLAVPTLSDTVPTAPPQTGDSGMVFVTTTGQLYTWTGTMWHSIADQVAAATTLVPAANITGQLTNAQILDLAAAKLTGQITGTQILDGTISTPELSAGAVTTAKLAAGAVTTEVLSVGSSTNVIWNSCLEQGSDGWVFGAVGNGFAGGGAAHGTVKGTVLDPTWRLVGYGTGYMNSATALASNGSTFMVAAWDPNSGDTGSPLGVPFPPSTAIEFHALSIPLRSVAHTAIDFYDSANAYISSLYGNRVVALPGVADGMSTARYVQSWTHGVSPANAARARALIICYNDGGADILPGNGNPPVLFWTQTALGVSVANATQPQPWAPGGVTSISGGMIKSRTIVANQIAAQTIGANEIAAGAIIAGKIAANAVIAGTVQAGAIGASEIAAGQIRATHLASDFVLSNSAQFGTAVIDTAQIRDLAVGTLKVAPSAITNIYLASSANTQDTFLNVATDGSPILMFFDNMPGYSTNQSVSPGIPGIAQIYRNGVPIPGYHLDQPGAGVWQYQLHFTANPGDAGGATDAYWRQWYNVVGVFCRILAMVIKK
jgi:predicted phage tail protein